MSLVNKESIFEAYASQRLDHINPQTIRTLSDKVLIRDIPDEEMAGCLHLPQSALDNSGTRIGIVVTVGPGDRFREKVLKGQATSSDGKPEVKHRSVKTPSGKLPMEVQVGDRVIYTRRKDMEFIFEGARHSFMNEEQSILAIVE